MTYIGNTSPSRFSSVPAVQRFSGNNSTTAFTLSTAIGSEQEILVSVDGVIQDTANYTVSGTTLTFSPAPSAGTNNIFVFTLSRAIASVTHPPTSALSATSGTFSGNVSVGGDLDVTGSLDMSDANLTNVGSISLDSISGDADANTNITFSGSDVITFTTGGSTAFTANANQSVTFSGNIIGTLATAAQTNITSVGTLASFRSTGIDDNADALAITIDASERVGIGTTSPSQSLHVKGNIDVEGDTSGVSKIRFKAEETHGEVEGINIGSNFGGLAFKTNSNGTVAERMRINSSGNVMIGGTTAITTSGQTSLTIGNGSANPAITLYSATNNQGQISFGDATSGTGAYEGYIYYHHNTNVMGFGTNHAERMRIHSAGRIGIGTSGNTIQGSLVIKDVVDHNGSDVFVVAQNGNASRQAGYKVFDEGGTSSLEMIYDNGDNFARIINPNNGQLSINLGGTGTANKLDDYEEGLFTPTLALSGATLASTDGFGRYTKIGRHVYVEGKVTRNTAAGGAASTIYIESLPFTSLSANNIGVMGSGTIWMDEGGPGTNQGDTIGHAYVPSNTARAELVRGTSSGAQTSARYGRGSEMTNGRPLYFNFVYTTA